MPSYTLISLLALATSAFVSAQEKATFTHYGSGDSMGSANCATAKTNACGPNNPSGFTAAMSQKQFGVGPGGGAGPGCGECWTLTIETDQTGKAVAQKSINVTINNLCPISGNEQWCQVPNKYGGQVHFDLCSDTGAADAFFTSSGSGIGSAVPCGSGYSAAPPSSKPAKSSVAATKQSTEESETATSYEAQKAYETPAVSSTAGQESSSSTSVITGLHKGKQTSTYVPAYPGSPPASTSTQAGVGGVAYPTGTGSGTSPVASGGSAGLPVYGGYGGQGWNATGPATGAGSNSGTGSDTGSGSGAGAGAASGPGAGAKSGTGSNAGSGPAAGANSNSGTGSGTGYGSGSAPGAGSNSGTGSGSGTNPGAASPSGSITITSTIPLPTGVSSSSGTQGAYPGIYPAHCRLHARPGRYHAGAHVHHPSGPPAGYGADGCPYWEARGVPKGVGKKRWMPWGRGH